MAKSDRPFWGIGTPVENSVLHEVDTPVVTSILSRSSNIFHGLLSDDGAHF
jgi:hypothetical protein